MKNRPPTAAFTAQACEALISMLHQVSWIRPGDVALESPTGDSRVHLLARIHVLGRTHTLACAMHQGAFEEGLDSAIFDLYTGAAALDSAAMPVLIASSLSAEAQSLCRENRVAYIDLKGNARIDLGEVFIARHAVPQNSLRQGAPHKPACEPAPLPAAARLAQASA